MVVQFEDDEFPSLLTEVKIPNYEEEGITIGHVTVQGNLEKEENADGYVWLTSISS